MEVFSISDQNARVVAIGYLAIPKGISSNPSPAGFGGHEAAKQSVTEGLDELHDVGSGDHVAICQPRLFFGNRCNVVTGRPQRPTHGKVAALIGEESHWSVP